MRRSVRWGVTLCCLAGLGYAADAAEVKLKMGMPFPKSSREGKAVAKAAKDMAAAQKGKVNLVRPPPDKKGPGLAKKILDGTLDGGLVMGRDFSDLKLGQDAFAYAVPFTFRSAEQVRYVRKALDAEILRELSAGPYEAMGVVGFGSAYVMSAKALSTPGDWRERRIWVPAEGEFAKSLNGLGLKTVPSPVKDVLKGLRAGSMDTVIVPPSGAILKRWHRGIKKVFDVPFVYLYGIWVVRDESLARLSPEARATVRKHLPLLCQELGATIRKRNDDARTVVLPRWQIEFVAPDVDMQKQWEQWATKIWQNFGKEHRPTRGIEDKLKKRLDAFDRQKG